MNHYWTKVIAAVSLSGGIIATAATLGAWTTINPSTKSPTITVNDQAKKAVPTLQATKNLADNWKPNIEKFNDISRSAGYAYDSKTNTTYIGDYNADENKGYLKISHDGINFAAKLTLPGQQVSQIYVAKNTSGIYLIVDELLGTLVPTTQYLYYVPNITTVPDVKILLHQATNQLADDYITNLKVATDGTAFFSYKNQDSTLATSGLRFISDPYALNPIQVASGIPIGPNVTVSNIYKANSKFYITTTTNDKNSLNAYVNSNQHETTFSSIPDLALPGSADPGSLEMAFGPANHTVAFAGDREKDQYYYSTDGYHFKVVKLAGQPSASIASMQFTALGSLYVEIKRWFQSKELYLITNSASGILSDTKFSVPDDVHDPLIDNKHGGFYYYSGYSLYYNVSPYSNLFDSCDVPYPYGAIELISSLKFGGNNLIYIFGLNYTYYITNVSTQVLGNAYAKTTYKFLWFNVYFGLDNSARRYLGLATSVAKTNNLSEDAIINILLNLKINNSGSSFKHSDQIWNAGLKQLIKHNFRMNQHPNEPIEVYFTIDIGTPFVSGYPWGQLWFHGYNYAYNPS